MRKMENARSNIRTIAANRRLHLKEIANGAGITYEALRLFLNGGDMKFSNILRISDFLEYEISTLTRKVME